MGFVLELIQGGLGNLAAYLAAHVLLCMVPAFFIAGAISCFVSQAAVMKYLGAGANKVLAYGVSSVSGSILAVCSCTVLCRGDEPQLKAVGSADHIVRCCLY